MSNRVALSMTSEMTETQAAAEPTVGMRQYLDVLRRRKLTVVATVALALGAAVLFTMRQQPEYRAQTTIVVGQAGGLVQPQNAGAIQPFSATMQELIRSGVVARKVISALGLKETPEALLGRVSVSFNPESAALNVSVLDRYPERAQAIAERIGIAFSALVKERFGQTADGSAAIPPLTATVWDPAHVIPGKIRPTPKLNITIAAILGLVLGLLAAFVVDFFDRRLRTIEEIERAVGVPVIGQIPSLNRDARRPTLPWEENRDVAEAFRALRANLQYLGVDRPLRTILVTSTSPEQGKTTVCANLGTALAQSGESVVVVEADLRRPRLGYAFGIAPFRRGLTSVLVGGETVGNTLNEVSLPDATTGVAPGGNPRMAVLPSGPLPPNPSELVASLQMQTVMSDLKAQFDHVIVDSPPMLIVADALELAKHVDGVIVVVRRKRVTSDEAKELRTLTARLGIHLVGVVVTDVPARAGYHYPAYEASPGSGVESSAAPVWLSTGPGRIPSETRDSAKASES